MLRAVSVIYFHRLDEGAIVWLNENEQFDHLTGISSCFQCYMLASS